MPQPAELPEETYAGRAIPANDPSVPSGELSAVPEFHVDTTAARTPMRFGRLALWMASASALGIGVLGTVAYSMWFTHDQRVYAEAMSSARNTLGIEQPAVSAAAQTQSAGVVEPAAIAPNTLPVNNAASVDTTQLADNAPSSDIADSATSGGTDVAGTAGLAAVSAAAAAKAQGSDVSRKAATRAGRSNPPQTYQTAQVPRRHVARNTGKAEPGLFARMGAFFHRVSYQRNVPSHQREEYSRP
jgi:hypothetical protein